MKEFKLTLNNTTYECSSCMSSKDKQNWLIRAEMYGMRVTIDVPIETELTTIQVMAFIERFHEGMKIAKEAQKQKVDYIL